ncbi:MAG: galactokinase, partial [Propionicimonas sp.]
MLTQQATDAFVALTGSDPSGVWAAPGRINLIGEHTDYNDGFVLPFALPHAAYVAAAPRTDGRWRFRSVDLDDTVEIGGDELVPGTPGWASYLAGVIWALQQAGHHVGGADLVLTSDVPLGAGLSSSAAIECAALAALADLNDLTIEPMERAKLARVAENAYVGAPTGLMDQAASTLCVADHALFLDCRTLQTRQVPLAVTQAGLEILVIDTRTRHSHVSGEYADRRASCEQACELLGVPALRDVEDLDAALARLPELIGRRVRHVVTEDQRVRDSVAALDAGDYPHLGALMTASHASMRDDYEITERSVDLAVATALAEGALGARMTGGGFGGCVLALVASDQVEAVGDAVRT